MYESAKLPDKPSELILRAIEDVESALEIDTYNFDINAWHETSEYYGEVYNYGEVDSCCICVAGGIMAATIDFTADVDLIPSEYNSVTRDKLFGLDVLCRVGDVTKFLKYLSNKTVLKVLSKLGHKNPIRKLEADFVQCVNTKHFESLKLWLLKVVNVLKKYEDEGLI